MIKKITVLEKNLPELMRAFPSNDFKQEPLAGDKVGSFCQKNYGVTFKIAEKTSVRGDKSHEVYKFLSKKGASSVKWNFYKALIDKRGDFYKSYNSFYKPEGGGGGGGLEKDIKKLLK